MVMLLQHLAGEALHPESKLSQEEMAGKAQPLQQLCEQDRSFPTPHLDLSALNIIVFK